MLANFITVIQQVLILTAVIGAGYISKKKNWLEDASFNTLTNLTMYLAIPCLLIRAFSIEYDPTVLKSFFGELLITLIFHLVGAGIGFLVFKNVPGMKKRVYICCITLGNIGFMGYPLITALYGNLGLLYGSAYNLVFNIVMWSVGVRYLVGDTNKVRLVDILINPNIWSAVLGFLVYILQIHIPEVVDKGMGYLAALAVPLPLLVIGARLTTLQPKKLAGDVMFWVCAALRLLIIPIAMAFILHAIGIRGTLLSVSTLLLAMPTASILGMVAGKNDPETGIYTAGVISALTALSIVTIPIVAVIISMLA